MIVYDIQGLVKQYPGQPKPANDNITLQIQEGEIFGLLGDNGAGKSTLVKQMVNLVAPTSGTIRFMGQSLLYDPLRVPMNVGYMPQDGLALNSLTIGEALFFTAHLCGMSRSEAREERERLLALWQIEEIRNKTPKQISGGQMRLMQIAVAMAAQPPVLILDEPTNDLDPQRRKQVWDVLRQLNRTQGTTIIFITHDAVEAEKIIQRVGIMHAGKMVALGKPSELKRQLVQRLRLELVFSPDTPPNIPSQLTRIELDAGRWLIYLQKEDVAALFNRLNLDQLDDFRLYSATLEDLYLHYSGAL
ncbi:MAG: ABC transporter ATP-binding protein [Ardenticatenaceae bacterium]